MSNLLVLKNDGIYLPDGVTKYVPPARGPRAVVLREYTRLADPLWQKRINSRVGTNPYGEPLYRIIWGWNRLEWLGGLIDRYNESGDYLGQVWGEMLEPKYSYLGDQCNRWMVEKWMPAEMYGSPETWEEAAREISGLEEVQALGPYPSRGDYELSAVLGDTKSGGYISIDSGFLDDTIGVLERIRELDGAKRQRLKEEREAKKAEEFRKKLADLWDDSAVAFGGRPNSTQANAPMRNTKKMTADVAKFPVKGNAGMSVA